MSGHETIPLVAVRTGIGEPDFKALMDWPFADTYFYERQIKRLLQTDISFRLMYGAGIAWVYKDPSGIAVGFGTLDICREYSQFTDDKDHPYIPLLAVHPQFQKRGHGRTIVRHLIAEAAIIARSHTKISNYLFLDIYTANYGAISLYEKSGFNCLNPDAPVLDADENNEPYLIMAMNASVSHS